MLAVFDPIGHEPWTLGQADGADRQWNEQAWRDPEVWKDVVVPWRYGDSQTYLGNNPSFLNKPVIPGDIQNGRTYTRPDNYLPEINSYWVE